jgi:osmoprotectant transport system permease protein
MSLLPTDNDLPGLGRATIWLNDPQNWWGESGLLARIREHLLYTLIAVALAALIAVPLGLLVGHTGRGAGLVGAIAGGIRAVPSLGLVVLLVVWISPHIHTIDEIPGLIRRGGLPYLVPVLIVLVALAIPPLLTSTYAGVQAVDPVVRDAAKGMGMTGAQVVRKVEIPIALPLMLSGLRSATLQVLATATVAAFVPFLGGLGRFIKDGTGRLFDLQYGYPAMVGAGIVVAVLAVVVDGLLYLVQRLAVSPGLRPQGRKK